MIPHSPAVGFLLVWYL